MAATRAGTDSHDRTICLTCPAKVNLALSVGTPHGSGYHPIASWMVAVNFGDQLTIRRLTTGTSTFTIHFTQSAPQPQAVNWPTEKDLSWRAHQLMEQQTSRSLPVQVKLAKQIPAGAGLGGGSSDAAGMLIALNKLFDLGIGKQELAGLGQRLGSDVSFLITVLNGTPSAIVTGTGSQVEAAPMNAPVHLVLIFPPFRCSTALVYTAFDSLAAPEGKTTVPGRTGSTADQAKVRRLAAHWPLAAPDPFNDLAEAVARVKPQLNDTLKKVQEALGKPVHVTGSGSGMFVIAPSAEECQTMTRQVTEATGLPAVATRTLDFQHT